MSLAFFYASPVRDAVTEHVALHYHLAWPWAYVIFAPFCTLADYVTILSLKEMAAFLAVTFGAALVVPRGWKLKSLSIVGLLGFLTWTALAPRPMARLIADDPDILLIDMHSHTVFSHDGRPGFTPDANRRWHWRQGFHAAFITDHNVVVSAQIAKKHSRADWRVNGYRSLEGDEASLTRTHLNVLGAHRWINNSPYDSLDPSDIPRFIADMHAQGYLVTANLPEYWRFHWAEGNMDFLMWKVDGFEIANSAPRALDFPPTDKRLIIRHCRQNNLFVDGASDNHGWGSATSVWNAMRIPGWQGMDPDQLETVVLKTLKREGFHSVQVLERIKYFPENNAEILVSPFANAVVYVRTLGWPSLLSWAFWIGLFLWLKKARIPQIHTQAHASPKQ